VVSLIQYKCKEFAAFLVIIIIVWLFVPRSHRSSGAYLHERNSFHSCIYLSSFLCDRKFVFAFEHVQGVAEMSSKCHRSKEKGTVRRVESLFLGGLEISPNLATEKIPRLFKLSLYK